jgi:hypothetical protein
LLECDFGNDRLVFVVAKQLSAEGDSPGIVRRGVGGDAD